MTAPAPTARPGRSKFGLIAVCLLALLLSPLCGAGRAQAATPEESFVTKISDQAIAILTNKSLDKQGRYNEFHNLILGNIDLERIAVFALGRYAGSMRSSGRYDEYKTLFGEYIARVYAARLGTYSGEHLKIGKSVPVGGDVVVFSSIEPGAEGGDPIAVNWRLSNAAGQLKIMDVQVVGAWMSIEQQAQFASIITNNNRDVTKLLDYLKEQTAAPLP